MFYCFLVKASVCVIALLFLVVKASVCDSLVVVFI